MAKKICTVAEVLAYEKKQLGVKESPPGSNNVKYNRFFGFDGVSWCVSSQVYCFIKAGGGDLVPHNIFDTTMQDAIVSRCGGKTIMGKAYTYAKKLLYLKKFKPGDVVTFDFGKNNGYREHIGMIVNVDVKHGIVYCYEGNTSSDNNKSQSNGGEFCLKARSYRQICKVVRPAYAPEKKKAAPKKDVKPKIYVNAGHSNTDTGAVSKYGKERVFNVKVRNAMVKYLEDNYNVEVKYNKGTVGDMKKITAEANEWKADLYVSIHFNSANGKADGWEGLLYNLDEKHKACGKIFEKHVKAIGQNSRGLKARPDLKNLKLTDMMAILNECAFIDNWKDIKDWNEDKELEKMGIALAKAAAEYTGAKAKRI